MPAELEMGDETLTFTFALGSPDLDESSLLELAQSARLDLESELFGELEDIYSGPIAVEVTRINPVIILVILVVKYVGGAVATGVVGAAAVEVIKRVPGVIARVLGKRPPPKADGQQTVIVVAPEMTQEQYDSLVEALANMSEAALEAVLSRFPEYLREKIRQDLERRRRGLAPA